MRHDEFLKDLYERLTLHLAEKESASNPQHYRRFEIQHWDVVADWDLDYFEGCATKYIARIGAKDEPVQEMQKAICYLEKLRSIQSAKISAHKSTFYELADVIVDWSLRGYLKKALKYIFSGDLNTAIGSLEKEIAFYETHRRQSSDGEAGD